MKGLFRLGVIVELIERVSGPARRALAAISNLENAAKKAAAIAALAGSIGMAGTAASQAAEMWRGAVFDLLTPTVAVQDAMAALSTVTTSTMGTVQRSLDATKQAAVDWSAVHSDAADQFLRTSYQMASAGLNDVQAIEGTRAALRVARATMADSSETANTLAIIYNNLGNKTADVKVEMNRLGDVLTRTQALFQIANLGQLTEGLKYGTPTAVAFGSSVEELNVVLGALNSAGLQGGMAGTAYSAAMRQMLKASKDLGFEIVRDAKGGLSFIGTLSAMKQQFGDASTWSDDFRQRMQQAFGDEGLRAVTLLVGKTGDLTAAWKDVASASGTAASSQAAFESTLGAQAAILNNNLSALKMELAASLIPALNDLIPRIQAIFQSLSQWSKAHPGLSRMIVLLLAIGAGILTIVAPILTATSAFLMMTSGGIQAGAWIGRAILSLGGIVSRASGMITTMQIRWLYAQDAMRAGWTAVVSSTRTAGLAIGRVATSIGTMARTAWTASITGLKALATGIWQMGVQAVRTAVTALPGLIASTWAFTVALLANPITWIVLAIIGLITAIVLLWRNWDTVTAWIGGAWAKLKAAFAAGMDWIRNILGRIGGFFKEHSDVILAVILPVIGIPKLIIKHWDSIVAFFGNLWENVKIATVNGLISLGQWIIGKFQGMLAWFTNLREMFADAGKGLFNAFIEGIQAVINKPIELVKAAVGKIRDLLPGSDAKAGPLRTLTKSGKALVTTFGGGMVRQLPQLRERLAGGLADLLPTWPMELATAGGPSGFGLFPAPQIRLGSGRDDRGQRTIVIERLYLQVQRMDNPEDLFDQLRSLADEIDPDGSDGEVTPE